jgi:hypothetical protein
MHTCIQILNTILWAWLWMTLHLPTFAHLGHCSTHIRHNVLATGQQYEQIAQAQWCSQTALPVHSTRIPIPRNAWLNFNTHLTYSTWVTVGLNSVEITTTKSTAMSSLRVYEYKWPLQTTPISQKKRQLCIKYKVPWIHQTKYVRLPIFSIIHAPSLYHYPGQQVYYCTSMPLSS